MSIAFFCAHMRWPQDLRTPSYALILDSDSNMLTSIVLHARQAVIGDALSLSVISASACTRTRSARCKVLSITQHTLVKRHYHGNDELELPRYTPPMYPVVKVHKTGLDLLRDGWMNKASLHHITSHDPWLTAIINIRSAQALLLWGANMQVFARPSS